MSIIFCLVGLVFLIQYIRFASRYWRSVFVENKIFSTWKIGQLSQCICQDPLLRKGEILLVADNLRLSSLGRCEIIPILTSSETAEENGRGFGRKHIGNFFSSLHPN